MSMMDEFTYDPEELNEDGLNYRQQFLEDALETMVEDLGQFDQGTGPDGSHYMDANPFVNQGIACKNCIFYSDPNACDIVSGEIDPDAICKFWVIPGDSVQKSVTKFRGVFLPS